MSAHDAGGGGIGVGEGALVATPIMGCLATAITAAEIIVDYVCNLRYSKVIVITTPTRSTGFTISIS